MTIKNKFDIMQQVFVVHDPEQQPWMVASIEIMPIGLVYHLRSGTQETSCCEVELSGEKLYVFNAGVN